MPQGRAPAGHRAIVDAIRRSDAGEAERITRAHVADTRQGLRRTLTAAPPSAGG